MKPRSIEVIKDEVAKKSGSWTSWSEFKECSNINQKEEDFINQLCKSYATECCIASLKKAANNASFRYDWNGKPYNGTPHIDKSSITDDSNIEL